MRVSKKDLDFYNVTSIALADGSGYAAELGVHHELHCLVSCAKCLASELWHEQSSTHSPAETDQALDLQRLLSG